MVTVAARVIISKRPHISLKIASRATTYGNYLYEIMACECFVEHLVGSLYFLQQKLFLRFSQISMLLAISCTCGLGFLPAEAGYFLTLTETFSMSKLNHIFSVNQKLSNIKRYSFFINLKVCTVLSIYGTTISVDLPFLFSKCVNISCCIFFFFFAFV